MYEAEERLLETYCVGWDSNCFWPKMNRAGTHYYNDDTDTAARLLDDACNILLKTGPLCLGACKDILNALSGFDGKYGRVGTVIDKHAPAVLQLLESFVDASSGSLMDKADVMERIADTTIELSCDIDDTNAIKRYRRTLALREEANGRDDVRDASLLKSLGQMLYQNDEHEEAAGIMTRILIAASNARATTAEHSNIPYILSTLSECHRALRNEMLADKFKAQLDAFYSEEDMRTGMKVKA